MNTSDTEEFAGVVRLRLIENDYAIIRKFKERSSFGTLMTTVVSRLLNDHRDHEWGKWRTSAEARRLGEMAIELEKLLVRDARTPDEAFVELAAKYRGVTRAGLEKLAEHFPVRHRRRRVSLEDRPEPEVSAQQADLETSETAAVISSIVGKFIDGLPPEDKLIVQLRFEGDLPVPQIARSLHQDTQLIYRKLRKHYDELRIALDRAGIAAMDVARLAGLDAVHLDFHFKKGDRSPSNGDEGQEVAPEEGA